MIKNYIKSSLLLTLLVAAMVSFTFFTAQSSYAGTTISMCPGSGESCEVTFPDAEGKTHTVRSVKDPNKDAVTVTVE